jgi:transposase
MRPTYGLPSKAVPQLEALLQQTDSKVDYRRVLCLWLRATLGLSASEIATALGWCTGSVHNLHSRYLREGTSALVGVGRGGRRRQLLSVEEEEALLLKFTSAAEQGGVAEASRIRAALEQQVGHAVPKSTIYRLLARHGWRKLVPRPFHPDVSPEVQEAFKKSFGAWCAPKPYAKQNAVWRCV